MKPLYIVLIDRDICLAMWYSHELCMDLVYFLSSPHVSYNHNPFFFLLTDNFLAMISFLQWFPQIK